MKFRSDESLSSVCCKFLIRADGTRILRYGVWWRLIVITSVLAVAGCSIPNLESPQCTEARNAVKRFYSFHFGSDMSMTPENLKARETFLTDDLVKLLAVSEDNKTDYFTATDNYPKAFRVGSCDPVSEEKTIFQVVLLWRDETKSDQREVQVEAIKNGDKWLINKVSN